MVGKRLVPQLLLLIMPDAMTLHAADLLKRIVNNAIFTRPWFCTLLTDSVEPLTTDSPLETERPPHPFKDYPPPSPLKAPPPPIKRAPPPSPATSPLKKNTPLKDHHFLKISWNLLCSRSIYIPMMLPESLPLLHTQKKPTFFGLHSF